MTVTPQTNTTLEAIADVIRSGDDFVICGHVSPDGDCLGGQLALAHALWSLGKKATCVLVRDEPIGAALEFMPGTDRMVPAERFEGPCGVFVAVDVPTRERIGEAACGILDRAGVSITVDHHASESSMSDFVYVDPDCAAASILIWDIVKMLVVKPSATSATCAYVGLLTDTGGFRFQNCDAQAFETAADMVACGADPSEAASNVYQNRSLASLELEALVINRLSITCGGKAALSWIDEHDMASVGAVKADVEPLIDVVRSISGVLVACMLREQDGLVRGNLRAKDDTDVAALARELGGGGHKAAAGFNLDMPITEAVNFMNGKFAELLQDSRS